MVGGFKPAFAKRDKKQAMIDLRRILTNWFKNQQPGLKTSYVLPRGFQDCGLWETAWVVYVDRRPSLDFCDQSGDVWLSTVAN